MYLHDVSEKFIKLKPSVKQNSLIKTAKKALELGLWEVRYCVMRILNSIIMNLNLDWKLEICLNAIVKINFTDEAPLKYKL